MAPSKPSGVTTEKVTKRAAYGNYGSEEATSRVQEPAHSGREPYQGEERVERSPARPNVREWASPSYSKTTGRGHIFSDGPGGDRQVPSAGRHTAPNNSKSGSRPGRW